MGTTTINFLPGLLLIGGLLVGLIIGLVRKPRKKWRWLWSALIGLACGAALLVILGLIDFLIQR